MLSGLTLIFIYHYYYYFFFFLGMAIMKENRGKEVVDKGNKPETQSQARLSVGHKRKSLSKNLDLGNLPSRRGKRLSMGHPKQELSSLHSLRLNHPSRPLM